MDSFTQVCNFFRCKEIVKNIVDCDYFSHLQRMLELAEQRSKALGMTSTNKFPLAEYNQEASLNTMKSQSSPKKSPSPTKKCSVIRKESNTSNMKSTPQRMSSADAKENVDVALEINITTGPNVQVNV